MGSRGRFTARTARHRHAPVWLGLVAVLLATPAAAESRVVDVRVGLHADHTRVVIELDGPGAHRIERGAKGDELSVSLDAAGARRRVASKSPLVSAVVVEPRGDGAVARIALREPGLEYSELRLQSPPRIVIDVRRGSVAGRRPAREAAPVAEDVEVAEAPSPDDAPSRPAAAAAPARDPFAPPAGYEALVAAQRNAGGGLSAEAGPAPGTEPAPKPEAAAPKPPPVAAAAPAKPLASPPPETTAPPATPPVSAARPAPAPADESAAPLLGRLASIDPTPLLFLLAALVITWLAYRRIAASRTRRMALASEEPLEIFGDAAPGERTLAEPRPAPGPPAGPLFAWEAAADEPVASEPVPVEDDRSFPVADDRSFPVEDDRPAPVGEPASESIVYGAREIVEDESVEPAGREPMLREEPAASIDVPAEAPPRPAVVLALVPPPAEAEGPGTEPAGQGAPEGAASPGWQTLAVPPAALQQSAEEAALSAELEKRIAQLESRIEELRDARERLERFAAAQNEELRVQRAAIARTQRVIRSLSRPEDGAEATATPSE